MMKIQKILVESGEIYKFSYGKIFKLLKFKDLIFIADERNKIKYR